MDEFDDMIRKAKTGVTPREDFVGTTMKKVSTITPRKKWGMKILIPSAATGLIVIAALLFVPQVFQQSASTANTNATPPTYGQQQAAIPPVTPPTSIDNSSLQADLNSIGGSMNQESTDQNSATSSLNDSSQQINVPSS